MDIPGIGDVKAKLYGPKILEIINKKLSLVQPSDIPPRLPKEEIKRLLKGFRTEKCYKYRGT